MAAAGQEQQAGADGEDGQADGGQPHGGRAGRRQRGLGFDRGAVVGVGQGPIGASVRADDGQFDGRTRVRLAAPSPLDIARNLAGWGALVEVVEPESVQTQLARIGAELAARYPSPRLNHLTGDR